MKDTVIYHAGCWDGFCAAWLFHYWLPNADFIPAQYGDEPPKELGDRVFILDFSYPRDVLMKMQESAQVLVLDHHKTARDELHGLMTENLTVEFDMSRSGAHMAWDYLDVVHHKLPFHVRNPVRPHWLVRYTEDRDLWNWKLKQSKEVNDALRSYPRDFIVWDDIAKTKGPEHLAMEGVAISRYKQTLVDQHLLFARHCEIHGITAGLDDPCKLVAVNCSAGDLQSEVAGTLAEQHGVGATWVDQGDGNQLWSLRSCGGTDVSAIAKSLGGGGHKNAAGFRCKVGRVNVGERTKKD